ncbi:hypothetical protein B0J11DRAFT_506973 [Dendryphion nanum]|uniref:Uncharacterized protein n=1 Tax=Dendryphion nanum TaxID=256645 RepID=A0A9P9IKL4_9PLEO|nr:hypothetical protein B0J11DRAFT_506973 [Dendryphion nanum]
MTQEIEYNKNTHQVLVKPCGGIKRSQEPSVETGKIVKSEPTNHEQKQDMTLNQSLKLYIKVNQPMTDKHLSKMGKQIQTKLNLKKSPSVDLLQNMRRTTRALLTTPALHFYTPFKLALWAIFLEQNQQGEAKQMDVAIDPKLNNAEKVASGSSPPELKSTTESDVLIKRKNGAEQDADESLDYLFDRIRARQEKRRMKQLKRQSLRDSRRGAPRDPKKV